jgi:hypothetical protein
MVAYLVAATVMTANAKAEEPEATPPAPAPVTSTPPEPGSVMPPPPTAPLPAVVAPPPAVAAPEVPLKREPANISTVFGLRVGGRIQGASDASKLNDIGLDTTYLEARFSGTLDKYFGWQANFNADLAGTNEVGPTGTASVMDLILKFEPIDEFHVWAGRLLVPSDRSNFSGPFFMSPWNYPGIYGPTFIGPKTGPTGRDDGAVVWGNVLGGKGKYFLGAFNLESRSQSPLYSGRINIALLGTEPGFWGSSTYYGAKDIVAVGGAFQYQKNGSGNGTTVPTANLNTAIADLLAEKNIPGAGTASLEATYYHFDSSAPVKQDFYILASFLTADYVGIGKLQPLVRWQQTSPQSGGTKWTILDAFVTYVIHNYDLKLTAGYQRTDLGGPKAANAIQLGLQMQE